MDSARSGDSGLSTDNTAQWLFDQISEYGVVVLDEAGHIVGCNAAASRIVGRERADVIGRPFDFLYVPEEISLGVPGRDLDAARLGEEVHREGWRARPDGERYWADTVLRLLRDEHDRPRGFGCMLRDITGQHRSTQFLQSVLESALAAIVNIDARGRVLSFNRAAERMFGYSSAEVLGKSVAMLMTSPDREQHDEYIAAYFRTGQPKIIGSGREVIGRRQDGSTFPMELAVTRFELDGQLLFTGICRDVTVQHNLQAQLNQAQKMEAMGQLAGGIAHDFNNLLMIVAGYCEGLRSSLEHDDSRLPALEQIALAADKAAALTAQLLAFSRHSVQEPRVLDLNTVLANTTQLLRRTIGEDIVLNMRLDPQTPRVNMDEGHIEQILINLAVNARDAMPQGGELTIRTSVTTLADADATPRALDPGTYVRLDVRDSGTGMPPDVKARAFEPFFTTKARGRGTGLGLATVYGIVRQSGGHIEIDSEPGAGAIFKIHLPAVLGAAETTATPADAPPPTPTGSETILVVEDEPPVREIVVAMLKSLGYAVLAAPQPDDALQLAQSGDTRIDAVITDVVMPGISGRQLVERLWTLRPDLKVLFMSGYTDDAMLRHGITHAEVSFLQKPFTKRVLARKIREVLDRR